MALNTKTQQEIKSQSLPDLEKWASALRRNIKLVAEGHLAPALACSYRDELRYVEKEITARKGKRPLSPAQEAFLLRWYCVHDGSCSARTLDVLLRRGYMKGEGKRLVVTAKGKAYCDKYHLQIKL